MENPNTSQTNQNNTSFNSPRLSYSNIAAKQPTFQFPTKDQAIIFPSIDDAKLQEYILALGKLLQPKHILFASRIANNRICIYLSSKRMVDTFITEHKHITININNLQARRLITPAQRLLSNVSPTIPHAILEEQLLGLKIKLLSPITFLRIGITDNQYSHILSFRRQVYISTDDKPSIPESIVISHDETSYRIYLSSENCSICKQQGHTQSSCHMSIARNEENITHLTPDQQDVPTQNPNASQDIPPSENLTVHSGTSTTTQLKLKIQAPKRPPSSSPSPTASEEIKTIQFPKPTKQAPKKHKSTEEKLKSYSIALEPAKQMMQELCPRPILDFQELVSFNENSIGSPEYTVEEYTADIPRLLDLLSIIYPYLKEKYIKTHITKLKKKIMKLSNHDDYNTTSGDETDLSQNSTY